MLQCNDTNLNLATPFFSDRCQNNSMNNIANKPSNWPTSTSCHCFHGSLYWIETVKVDRKWGIARVMTCNRGGQQQFVTTTSWWWLKPLGYQDAPCHCFQLRMKVSWQLLLDVSPVLNMLLLLSCSFSSCDKIMHCKVMKPQLRNGNL